MMHFEGEALLIGGREYVGTVVVETEVSNASFDFEQGSIHGTEHVIDIVHHPAYFRADKVTRCMAENIDADAGPALAGWLTSNLSRVEKAFDLACKRAT